MVLCPVCGTLPRENDSSFWLLCDCWRLRVRPEGLQCRFVEGGRVLVRVPSGDVFLGTTVAGHVPRHEVPSLIQEMLLLARVASVLES